MIILIAGWGTEEKSKLTQTKYCSLDLFFIWFSEVTTRYRATSPNTKLNILARLMKHYSVMTNFGYWLGPFVGSRLQTFFSAAKTNKSVANFSEYDVALCGTYLPSLRFFKICLQILLKNSIKSNLAPIMMIDYKYNVTKFITYFISP